MGKWLARTWEGTLAKGVAGAALGALASWIATSDVHPLIVGISAAVVPVILNAWNKSDPRYGAGSDA